MHPFFHLFSLYGNKFTFLNNNNYNNNNSDSFISTAPLSQANVAEMAAERKIMKYSTLPANIIFETLGPINQPAVDFFSESGCRL